MAEELANRKATATEFFLAYVYSNTDNIQANLHYLDYTRLKKAEVRKEREAAAARKTGHVWPPADDAGRWTFDSYAETGPASASTADSKANTIEVEIAADQAFRPRDGRPCWWRRGNAPLEPPRVRRGVSAATFPNYGPCTVGARFPAVHGRLLLRASALIGVRNCPVA